MIDEEETFKKFGYRSSELGPYSKKKVIAICNICGKIREVRRKLYYDLCFDCSMKTNEHRKKMSEIMTSPEILKEQLKWWTEKRRKAESESKIGEKSSWFGCKHTKDSLEKMRLAKLGENNGNYKGGISDDGYCSLFNEPLKVVVRNYFDNKCFLCGATVEENGGRQMSVHHVGYQKKCGCNNMQFCIYSPLCISHHMKTNGSKEKNRWYWYSYITRKLFMEHPNYSLYHIPAFGFDQIYYNYEYVFKGNYNKRKSN